MLPAPLPLPQHRQRCLYLTTRLFDDVQQFFWGARVYFYYPVGFNCLQVVVLLFYVRPGDSPAVLTLFPARQQLEELIEVGCGRGLRLVTLPSSLPVEVLLRAISGWVLLVALPLICLLLSLTT